MGWANQYDRQRQARQLREIERNTAAAAGVEPRKLTWMERHVDGVKDPKHPPVPVGPPAPPDARIAYLEGRVAALEARVQWSIDVIQDLVRLQQQGPQQS